jgi:hypothetical protein
LSDLDVILNANTGSTSGGFRVRYLKAIFRKTGARDRRSLLAAALGPG